MGEIAKLEKHIAVLESRFQAQKFSLVPSARAWRDGYLAGLKEALRMMKGA